MTGKSRIPIPKISRLEATTVLINAGDEGGNDDVQGPGPEAAPDQRLWGDQAAIKLLAGEIIEVNDETWTVREWVGDLGEVSADLFQSSHHDVFAPGISVASEIDAFTHMLWMSIPEMVTAINQAAVAVEPRWKQVTQRELGIWFGLFLGAVQIAEHGARFWAPNYDTLSVPDFRKYMAQTRFKEIRKHVPATMYKNEAADTDDWWRMRGGVERFNAKRRALLRPVPMAVLDESTSAWRPRRTKQGGLPHISIVMWKPEPLGTEFKNVADAQSGIMLALEIQEGKSAMYSIRARSGNRLAPATSCVASLVSELRPVPLDYKRVIIGDSWFTNVGTALEVARRKPVMQHENANVLENEMSDAHDEGGVGAATAHWNDHYVGVLKI